MAQQNNVTKYNLREDIQDRVEHNLRMSNISDCTKGELRRHTSKFGDQSPVPSEKMNTTGYNAHDIAAKVETLL